MTFTLLTYLLTTTYHTKEYVEKPISLQRIYFYYFCRLKCQYNTANTANTVATIIHQ